MWQICLNYHDRMGILPPEKAHKLRQIQFRDKTAYVCQHCLGCSLSMRSFAMNEPRSPACALYATLHSANSQVDLEVSKVVSWNESWIGIVAKKCLPPPPPSLHLGIYDTFLSAESPKTDNIRRKIQHFYFGIIASRNDQIWLTPSYVLTAFHCISGCF